MKFYKGIVILFLLYCFSYSGMMVFGETPTILIQLTVGSKIASVNGKSSELDVPPTVISGRTLVPIRFISETLGAEVQYDAPTRKITIKAPDGKKLLALDVENQLKIQSMEETITALKKQLEDSSKEFKNETNAPVILCKNVTDNMVISKTISLELSITDESPVAYVQTKIGNTVISSFSDPYGKIDPNQYLSGRYMLTIEVWDAFGNHGDLTLQVKIQNPEEKEPLSGKTEVKEIIRMGSGGPPGGGGGGGGQQPPGDRPMQTPLALYFVLENKAVSLLEITGIQVYNAAGELIQTRSDLSTIDMVKTQTGFSRLILFPTGTFSAQVAMANLEEGANREDLFKGWKIIITLFDSTMQKEYTKNILMK